MVEFLSKLFAILIACFFLIVSYINGGLEAMISILLFPISIALVCIFIPEIGSYEGNSFRTIAGPKINSSSMPTLVTIAGWILLFMPIWGPLIVKYFLLK